MDPANPTVQTYLSRTPHSPGNIIITQAQPDALIVEWDPNGSLNTLTVKVSKLTMAGWLRTRSIRT